MDYDNPQFVAAIKKILRNLAGETDEDKSAGSEQPHAQVEKELSSPVTHELNISDSTIDRIKTPTAHETRREWWKDFIEVAGIGVLTLYTMFAYFQWKELNTANVNQSAANMNAIAAAAETLRQGRLALNESTKNFRTDERAWVGARFEVAVDPQSRLIRVGLINGNVGKTYARQVSIFHLSHVVVGSKPMTNIAEYLKTYLKTHPWEQSARAIAIAPGAYYEAINTRQPTPSYFRLIMDGKRTIYVFGYVSYLDIFGQSHTTKFCAALRPDIARQQLGAEMCAEYNDAD
jgi:hypothetical protein